MGSSPASYSGVHRSDLCRERGSSELFLGPYMQMTEQYNKLDHTHRSANSSVTPHPNITVWYTDSTIIQTTINSGVAEFLINSSLQL